MVLWAEGEGWGVSCDVWMWRLEREVRERRGWICCFLGGGI